MTKPRRWVIIPSFYRSTINLLLGGYYGGHDSIPTKRQTGDNPIPDGLGKASGAVQMIVGIDYSLTAPAVAVLSDDGRMINTKHWAKQPKHKTHIHRCIWLANEITSFIVQYKPQAIYLEDFAFSANGKITAIAEGVGVLKATLLTNGIEAIPVAISSWKKTLTNNGRADKDLVRSVVTERFGQSLSGVKGQQDIADAIGVAYYALTTRR